MIHQKVMLWENDEAYMTTYILDNSMEFDRDRKRPAMLVLPGGAYLATSDREAEPVALAFAARGWQAFVLRYSCGEKARMPKPLLDAFQAVAVIRGRAGDWCVDGGRVAVCGFSAGGHAAACMAAMWNRPEFSGRLGLPPERIRPDAAVLCYPCTVLPNPIGSINTHYPASALEGMLAQADERLKKAAFVKDGEIHIDVNGPMNACLTGRQDWTDEDLRPYSPVHHVSGDTVPSFVWATATDELVPASSSVRYVSAMLEHGRNVEFHLFSEGPHGLSLATDLTAGSPAMANREAAAWLGLADAWLCRTLKIERL